MTPDPEAIRDLWEVDLEQEDLSGALDAAGVGRLAQLLRGASIPIVDAPAETVWIWSDLHLGDQALLAVGQRPFSTTLEMDDYLLEAWRRRVGLQDLNICLGDVVHPEAEPSTVAALRNCPGRRLLVLGNHDVGDRERLRDVGFVDQRVAVLCATDPPLALTHVPLRRVPPTAINVHGHLHGAPAPSPRHLKVSVERTDYAPIRLNQLLQRLPA